MPTFFFFPTLLSAKLLYQITCDVDPDWLYADPNKKKLLDPNPDPGQLNHQIFKNILFLKVKNSYSSERKKCWLNSNFCFILYLWIRILIHGPKWMRIWPDPHHWLWLYRLYRLDNQIWLQGAWFVSGVWESGHFPSPLLRAGRKLASPEVNTSDGPDV